MLTFTPNTILTNSNISFTEESFLRFKCDANALGNVMVDRNRLTLGGIIARYSLKEISLSPKGN